jgi:hypothetical protein
MPPVLEVLLGTCAVVYLLEQGFRFGLFVRDFVRWQRDHQQS